MFNVEIVVFVAKKLKEFLKRKGWFALPKLTKKGGNLITTTESRCSMRDLVEDFRFYLRAENCEELMPPFYYTTQASLFQMVSTLGFRVVKPRNRLILKYHCFWISFFLDINQFSLTYLFRWQTGYPFHFSKVDGWSVCDLKRI